MGLAGTALLLLRLLLTGLLLLATLLLAAGLLHLTCGHLVLLDAAIFGAESKDGR